MSVALIKQPDLETLPLCRIESIDPPSFVMDSAQANGFTDTVSVTWDLPIKTNGNTHHFNL